MTGRRFRSAARVRRRRAPGTAWPRRGLAVSLTVGGALLGWWLPHAERTHQLGGFAYDPSAAEATLGAIASGVITLTGFVLTAVTLVVQSVQAMSPRLTGVLGYFERSLVMFGALTGTAVYALVVLAQVDEAQVPRLSVTLAILFVVLSTGAILRRLAELREVVTGGGLVRIVGQRLHAALDDVWRERGADLGAAGAAGEGTGADGGAGPDAPDAGGSSEHPAARDPDEPGPDRPPHDAPHRPGVPETAEAPEAPGAPVTPATPAPPVPGELRSPRRGVVQRIDAAALADLAERLGTRITCLVPVGSFVEPGDVLLRPAAATPSAAPLPPAEARRLARAVRVGPSRSIDHDPAYGLRLLVDIAVRALSPSVNDPTTAVQALDQIESALLRLARRPLGATVVRDAGGAARVTVPRPAWSDLLDLALAEVVLYGADALQVHRRLRALLDRLDRVLSPRRATALAPYRATLDQTAGALPTAAMRATATAPDPQGLGGPRPDPAAARPAG